MPDKRYRSQSISSVENENPRSRREYKSSYRKSPSRSRSPEYSSRDRRKSYRRRDEVVKQSKSPTEDGDRPRRKKRSITPDRKPNKRQHSRSRSPRKDLLPSHRSKAPLPSQQDTFDSVVGKSPPPQKQKPNFGNSGLLAAASNTIQTGGQKIVLKYHEPSEARKPPTRDQWRMYVFKGSDIIHTVDLWEQSCWLFGREVSVVDIPLENPSCSKQHAVIQFRHIEKRNEFGDKSGKVRPYVIDLESSNGTTVTDDVIPPGRYVELRDKDVLKFGHSTREYVIQLPKE